MCGRFTLFESTQVLMKEFGVPVPSDLAPRYNIAPTRQIAAVRNRPDGGGREFALLRWGLIPSWAKDPSIGARMINARAETAPEKPSFRNAFRRRRCLVPASGFYEWQKQGRLKQPYYISLRKRKPMAIAGLWERWEETEGAPIESCTLLTTEANELIAPLHDRMPVIVAPGDFDLWLDPTVLATGPLLSLLRPFPADGMTASPVSSLVNNPSVDDPRCIEPAPG
jgi:putative SOS response-associated peptidase YedK